MTAYANQSWQTRAADPWLDRQTTVMRMLGALAIGSTTAQPAARALEDLIADPYLPPAVPVEPLTDALPAGLELLVAEVGLTEGLL